MGQRRGATALASLATLVALGLAAGEDGRAMTFDLLPGGAVVVAGAPVTVPVGGVAGEAVAWELLDFHGARVRRGEAAASAGRAALALGALKPGWYRLKCGSGEEVFLGAVLDRGKRKLPARGRVAGDAAAAWLLKRRSREDFAAFARLVRRAGIPWVRERLRWADVEPKPGEFDWGRYELAADAFAAEGVRVCQVWHDTPGWTHPGRPEAHRPDDLRTIQRFAREAARHFRGRIQAWEIWNEPDIFFWKETGDKYAGYFQAAAAGIRAGNPRALVLNGSLCSGVSAFARNTAAAGMLSGCDAFNWHLYKPPAEYPAALREYRELARATGHDGLPAWMTEAGIRLAGEEGPDKRLLSMAALREQARFVPRSVVMSLAAGNERHFFFVLPDYLENGIQFGALRPDLTPAPAFIALSAAANLLGESAYLGRLPAGAAEARVFRTPAGTVAAVWADAEAAVPVELPVRAKRARVADLFGAVQEADVYGGRATIQASRDPVYVLNVDPRIAARLEDRPAARRVVSRQPPSPVLLTAHTQLPFDKDADAYTPPAQTAPFALVVEAYHFGSRGAVTGTVRAELPPGWTAEPDALPMRLGPGERWSGTVMVTAARPAPTTDRITVRLNAGKEGIPAAVCVFQADLSGWTERPVAILPWGRADRWGATRSATGAVEVTDAGRDGLRFTARRAAGSGEGWWEAEYALEVPTDLSGGDAIAVEAEKLEGPDDLYVFLILRDPGGTWRQAGKKLDTGRTHIRFHFRDFGFAAPPKATALKLGVWSATSAAAFTAGPFRLVRLTPPLLSSPP